MAPNTRASTKAKTRSSRRRRRKLRHIKRKALPRPLPHPDSLKLPFNNGIPPAKDLLPAFHHEPSAIDYLVGEGVLKIPFCNACGSKMTPGETPRLYQEHFDGEADDREDGMM